MLIMIWHNHQYSANIQLPSAAKGKHGGRDTAGEENNSMLMGEEKSSKKAKKSRQQSSIFNKVRGIDQSIHLTKFSIFNRNYFLFLLRFTSLTIAK